MLSLIGMKNKYFNKLSLRNKGQHFNKSNRLMIDQLDHSSPPTVIFFSQSNATFLQASKKQTPDIQMCLTESFIVGHPKSMENSCSSCQRKHHCSTSRVGSKYNSSTSNIRMVTPRIIDIVLDHKKDVQLPKRNDFIHSFNQFSKVGVTERDFLKDHKASQIKLADQSLSRSFSSKVNSKNNMKKPDLIDNNGRKYRIEHNEDNKKSKNFNRIFKNNSIVECQNKSLTVSGIFTFPLKGTFKYPKNPSNF